MNPLHGEVRDHGQSADAAQSVRRVIRFWKESSCHATGYWLELKKKIYLSFLLNGYFRIFSFVKVQIFLEGRPKKLDPSYTLLISILKYFPHL